MATKKKPTITVSKKKAKSKSKARKKDRFSFADLPEELAERAREIWLAGLGALSMAEDEGVKLFNSLVEKGETWEKEGRKHLGSAKKKMGQAKGKVETVVEEAKGNAITNLDDKILTSVEATIEKVLQRLGVPTHAEVKDLTSKLEYLSRQVATLATVMEKDGKAPAKNGKAAAKSAKKAVYHVVPRTEGWAVKQEGVKEPLSLHPTKAEALKAGRSLAKAHPPSGLVTYKKDGKVQDSVTYEA